MQIRKHEIVMTYFFFFICSQYIQRYLYHVAALTIDPDIFGSIEWSCFLYYIIFLTGLLTIYDYIRNRSFLSKPKRLLLFITTGVMVRFVFDKIFTNIIQSEKINTKLLLPYHLLFILEWLYFSFLLLLLFFIFDKSLFYFQKQSITASIIILITMIVVSVLVYWVESWNLEAFGQSIFFYKAILSNDDKQLIFNAIQQIFFMAIISPSLLILFFKFTNPKSEGCKIR